MVKFINVYSSGVIVSCNIFFGSSSSHYPHRNSIPLRVSLVFRIDYTFVFALNISVIIFTITDCFTAASCVLTFSAFPPILSSYLIS